ncbi:hypothetical protein BVRB_4g077990 [Beta vulgaris subsp. vulgaris]|nr:hypothetical protein BVRB_4g077990 [Beta vulgaris subsp. vulgaris]
MKNNENKLVKFSHSDQITTINNNIKCHSLNRNQRLNLFRN